MKVRDIVTGNVAVQNGRATGDSEGVGVKLTMASGSVSPLDGVDSDTIYDEKESAIAAIAVVAFITVPVPAVGRVPISEMNGASVCNISTDCAKLVGRWFEV